MKKFKPIFTAVLALALLLAAMPAAVFAAEAPTETSLSVDDAFSSGRFVQMTREEYITGKASLLGISYSEAEAIVDKSIADAIAELPQRSHFRNRRQRNQSPVMAQHRYRDQQ